MTVNYEWDVEEVAATDQIDVEEGECLDHQFCESFAEVKKVLSGPPPADSKWSPVLVRDDNAGRSWAYMIDGKLPTHFEDAYQNPVAKVPQRFHKEVAGS